MGTIFPIIYFLFVSILTVFASEKPLDPHPLSDEFIELINSKTSTWRAGRNFDIKDWEYVKVISSGVKKLRIPSFEISRNIHDVENLNIPESFDAREAWPECSKIIGTIRDQSRCGACWAFGAVEAMSDRICIHSNGTRKMFVSAEDMLTCSDAGGCRGGYPYFAWRAWRHGVVTGGLYNHTEEGCKSYFLPPCNDHPHKCTDYVKTPACVTHCDNQTLKYKKQRTFGKSEVVEFTNELQIQAEIMKNGPVEADFSVYSDFVNYQSGIYQYTTGVLLGGHAVRIVGWGKENGVKYWLIANSWNQLWGENGYFRILRGQDECGIEEHILGALPDFTKF